MTKIVIIGGDHHNTLGVIESLGWKNVKSDVIVISSKKWAYVLKSKFVRKGWICNEANEIVSCLLSNCKDINGKIPIIATNDNAASILDDNFELLGDYFYLPNAKPAGTLMQKMDKEFMSGLARSVGLNVPKTWIVEDGKIPNDIEYPCITKAISSIAGTKNNITICRSEKDLFDFLSDKRHCKRIQIQKYIDKDFEFQFLGCSFGAGDMVLIPGRTHIDRPNGLDNTFFLWFDSYEPVFEDTVLKVKNFIKRTGFSGPFSVEFLRDKNDGKNYFTEMNYRNDGNAICVTKSGMNIPYIYYLYCIGGDYIKEIQQSSIHKVYLLPEFYYFKRMLVGEFGFKEWMSNVRKTDVCTTFFKDDIIPFLWFVLQIFDHILDRLRK